MGLSVVGILPATARAQRATLARTTQHETLANGLEVIIVENHAVPLATVELAVRAGAMIQTVEDQGVPHLYEHMLFKSYRGTDGSRFAHEASRLHAGYNGTTSEEAVTYYLTLPSGNTDDGIELMADMVREARFESDALNTERFVVIGEYQRSISDPRFHLHREVAKKIWSSAFHRKNTIGDEMAVLGATPDRLKSIFTQYYVPNNAALIVTGDVDGARVMKAARRRFGDWRRRPDPFGAMPVPPIPPLDSNRAVVVTGAVHDVSIYLQWQGPRVDRGPEDTYAADVLADLLNDKESGFHKRLVESGLFQHASLSYYTLAHVGPITFEGVTTIANLPGALTALQVELENMLTEDYFTERALRVAKKHRSVATALELERGTQLAHTLASHWAVAGLDYYLGYVDKLSTRSAADLRAFVDKYLTRRAYVVGALVSPEEAQGVATLLAQFMLMSTGK
ncbi:MAG: hypothetical protein NVS1B4_11180 [Gemmatimonadaceae bacterium]